MKCLAESVATAFAMAAVVIGGSCLFVAGSLQKWIDKQP